MKSKRRILTAATLSAFLAMAGTAVAHSRVNAAGGTVPRPASGKKGHRPHKHHKSHKGGKKNLRKTSSTTPPPK